MKNTHAIPLGIAYLISEREIMFVILRGLIVGAVVRDETAFVPRGKDKLSVGDLLILFVHKEERDKLKAWNAELEAWVTDLQGQLQTSSRLRVVFNEELYPGNRCFFEVQDLMQKSVDIEWSKRDDGRWELGPFAVRPHLTVEETRRVFGSQSEIERVRELCPHTTIVPVGKGMGRCTECGDSTCLMETELIMGFYRCFARSHRQSPPLDRRRTQGPGRPHPHTDASADPHTRLHHASRARYPHQAPRPTASADRSGGPLA